MRLAIAHASKSQLNSRFVFIPFAANFNFAKIKCDSPIIPGQITSYVLFKRGKLSKRIEILALIVMALFAVIFIVFTFYPPHLSIFQDSNTARFGF